MAKRLTLLTVNGEQVVDVPDDFLVLTTDYKFVRPEQSNYVILQPIKLAHDYLPFVQRGLPLPLFVSSSALAKVVSVISVLDVLREDVFPETMDAPVGYCLCGSACNPPVNLAYVKVYPVEEHQE